MTACSTRWGEVISYDEDKKCIKNKLRKHWEAKAKTKNSAFYVQLWVRCYSNITL